MYNLNCEDEKINIFTGLHIHFVQMCAHTCLLLTYHVLGAQLSSITWPKQRKKNS